MNISPRIIVLLLALGVLALVADHLAAAIRHHIGV